MKSRSRKKPKPGEPPAPELKRIAGIGDLRLRDVTTEYCQRLISETLNRGYSSQTATHIRNVISAIYTHAESKDWFSGRNPAKRVKLPTLTLTRELHALTFEQLGKLMAALDPLTAAMSACFGGRYFYDRPDRPLLEAKTASSDPVNFSRFRSNKSCLQRATSGIQHSHRRRFLVFTGPKRPHFHCRRTAICQGG